MNAVVAGSIVAALGESTVYAMEQVYLGNKSFDDIEWVKKLLESKLSSEFIERVMSLVKDISAKDKKLEMKDIAELIISLFFSKTGK